MSGWQRLSVVLMVVWTVLVGLFSLLVEANIPATLFFWLTPALLVFLLVGATRWVYRGFRRG